MSKHTRFLAKVHGFDTLDRRGRRAFAERMRESAYGTGQFILKQGGSAGGLHVIREGSVRVPIRYPDGRLKLEARLGPGAIVGEIALLTGMPRTADVVAEGRVTTLSIDRETLLPMLQEHLPLARVLTELLGRRLEEGAGIDRIGKYQLLGKIGEGFSSKVYEALHDRLDRVVAVKMLSHSLAYDPKFHERFLDEARLIASLDHPRIVRVLDTESAYATFFLVMERLRGRNLREVLHDEGPMRPIRAMGVLSQVGEALRYAHERGIVHRDVKPANCSLDEQGQVKLMDFGISHRVESGKTGRSQMVSGTPGYIAPEAALGRPVDGRADIYSLGVMAYEMVVGEPPYKADTVEKLLEAHVSRPLPDVDRVRPGLPAALSTFIQGAMAKDPDDRLTDWELVAPLLDPHPSTLDLGDEPMEERLIRLRYPGSGRREVVAACEALEDRLAEVVGADVAWATLPSPAGDPEV
jgi:eukaryotic-like serine/threonine-protein kinase